MAPLPNVDARLPGGHNRERIKLCLITPNYKSYRKGEHATFPANVAHTLLEGGSAETVVKVRLLRALGTHESGAELDLGFSFAALLVWPWLQPDQDQQTPLAQFVQDRAYDLAKQYHNDAFKRAELGAPAQFKADSPGQKPEGAPEQYAEPSLHSKQDPPKRKRGRPRKHPKPETAGE